MNTMVRKEMRDAIRWAPVGLIIFTIMIVYILRQPSYYYTLSNQLVFSTWLCSTPFALLLGLATFLPDEREAARAFLVHRGIGLATIFRRRVTIGLSVYFASMLIPLACTAIYLSFIGPLHGPVSPMQVLPALFVAISCAAMYFAGLIVACRPSNWLGTRLLPLGAAFAISVSPICILDLSTGWFTPLFLISGSLGFVLIGLASYYAFNVLPSRIGPTNRPARSIPLFIVLSFSALLICSSICVFPINFLSAKPGLRWNVRFDENGTAWFVTFDTWDYTAAKQSYIDKIKISEQKSPQESDSENELSISATSQDDQIGLIPVNSFRPSWDPSCKLKVLNKCIVWDETGYLMVYEILDTNMMRLKSIIGRDRITDFGKPKGLPFESTPTLFGRSVPFQFYGYSSVPLSPIPITGNAQYPILDLIDKKGVYQVDLTKNTIESVLKQDIALYGESSTIDNQPAKLFLQSSGSTSIYRMKMKEPQDQNWKSNYSLEFLTTIPALGLDSGHQLWFSDHDNWMRIESNYKAGALSSFHVTRSKDANVQSFDFRLPEDIAARVQYQNQWEVPLVMMSIPPILLSIPIVVAFGTNDPSIEQWQLWFLVGQMILTALFAWIAGRHRGLSEKQLTAWCFAGALFGVGTWLAILAIYPRVVAVACSNCKKNRRVEERLCQHCRAEWEAPEIEGIEIRENGKKQVPSPQSAAVSVG